MKETQPGGHEPRHFSFKYYEVARTVVMQLLLLAVTAAWIKVLGLQGHRLYSQFTFRPQDLLLGVAMGVSVWCLLEFLEAKALIPKTVCESSPVHNLTRTSVVVLSMVTGLSEECFFRGLVQAFCGVWCTSILFGLAHFAGKRTIPNVFQAFLVGLVYGGSLLCVQSLWVPVAAHITHNFIAYTRIRKEQSLSSAVTETV